MVARKKLGWPRDAIENIVVTRPKGYPFLWVNVTNNCAIRVEDGGSLPYTGFKHWCFVLRPEVTKGKRLRRVPIHRHLVEQGFLKDVEERRRIGKPLFYEPARARARVLMRSGAWSTSANRRNH
jgi:hypothetical protein